MAPSVYELVPAVVAILDDESLAVRWLAGEVVLADCVIPGSLQLDDFAREIVLKISPEHIQALLERTAAQERPAAASANYVARLAQLSEAVANALNS